MEIGHAHNVKGMIHETKKKNSPHRNWSVHSLKDGDELLKVHEDVSSEHRTDPRRTHETKHEAIPQPDTLKLTERMNSQNTWKPDMHID